MANTQSMCTSFMSELMYGYHQFGAPTLTSRGSLTAPTNDTFKGALYVTTATINAATTAYSATNEVTGTNYTAGGVTVDLIHELEKAGPFGSAQPEPLFVLPAHTIVDAALVGTAHVRVRIKSQDGTVLNGIAFRAYQQPLGDLLIKSKGSTLHLTGHLAIDRWGGGEKAQFRIVDAATPVR